MKFLSKLPGRLPGNHYLPAFDIITYFSFYLLNDEAAVIDIILKLFTTWQVAM